MSNNTLKPAPGGKIPTVIVVSLFWCLGIGIYWWLHQDKAREPSARPAEAPVSSAEQRTGPDSSAKTGRDFSGPRPAHYAAPLAPAPLTYGQVEPPKTQVPPPPPVESVPVLVADDGNYRGIDGGLIHGGVFLKGTPPPELPIRLDEVCGRMHPDGETTHRYIVEKESGGLANVVVYIAKGLEGKKYPVPAPIVLNQKGCLYEPYVSAAMVGQTVKIKNSDSILHNVHALPREDGNREFNFGQPNQGMVDETIFTRKITSKELMVKIKCDVHDWMLAYVSVFDHPYFAVTDTNGDFDLRNVPPGNYTIVATHQKAGSATNTITIGPGGIYALTFTLNAK